MKETGIIRDINNNEITIDILKNNAQACEHCKLKATCCTSSGNKKQLKIKRDDFKIYNVGDIVNIEIPEGRGILYSILIFSIPIIMLCIPLLILHNIFNDGINILFGVGLIVIYFFVLRKIQSQINKNIKILKK